MSIGIDWPICTRDIFKAVSSSCKSNLVSKSSQTIFQSGI